MLPLTIVTLAAGDGRSGVAVGAALATVAVAMAILGRRLGDGRRTHDRRTDGQARSALAPFRIPHTPMTPDWLRWAASVSRAFVLGTSIGAL